MPVLMLILLVSMKCSRNFGQHAVFSVSHLLLLCSSTGTATACIDWSGGKYLLVIECSKLDTLLKCHCSCFLCSSLLSWVPISVIEFRVSMNPAEIWASLGLSAEDDHVF